jgi:hypothetical protein
VGCSAGGGLRGDVAPGAACCSASSRPDPGARAATHRCLVAATTLTFSLYQQAQPLRDLLLPLLTPATIIAGVGFLLKVSDAQIKAQREEIKAQKETTDAQLMAQRAEIKAHNDSTNAQIKAQNDSTNAQIKAQKETTDAQIKAQKETTDAQIKAQHDSTNAQIAAVKEVTAAHKELLQKLYTKT